MKNILPHFKYILLTGFFVTLGLFLAGQSASAQNITVEFEQEPLFANSDFMPGDGTTRWFKVTNHTANSESLGLEAINTYDCSSDPYCLADVLQITIKRGSTLLYNNSLAGFFADGEVVLENIGAGVNSQYDVTVDFPSSTGNPYQTLSTYFDLIVGFIGGGSSGGGGGGSGGGGGGGSGSSVLLSIQKSGDPSVVAGLTGSYILTVSNQGNAVAQNVVVTDTLPSGFTFVSNGLGVMSWNLGDMAAGEVRQINYDMNVPVGVQGLYTNHAEVAAGGATSGNLFAEDDFDFTVVTVAGFETEEIFEPSPTEPEPIVSGYETEDQGYEQLPTTGGKILSLLGFDSKRDMITGVSRRAPYYYLWAIGVYLLLIGGLLALRKHLRSRN